MTNDAMQQIIKTAFMYNMIQNCAETELLTNR